MLASTVYSILSFQVKTEINVKKNPLCVSSKHEFDKNVLFLDFVQCIFVVL